MSAASASGGTKPPRYATLFKIASGGMATVFVGRPARVYDMRRLVAIKRPHPHLVEDESFSRSLLAEANLASRIHHDNVVSVRDVEVHDDSMHLVMDYVEGASLVELLADGPKVVSREQLARVGLRILLDACAGLHAAHELTDGNGRTLGLVHRDVSPHNILVGVDGKSRVVDFGIAKCIHQRQGMTTTAGTIKGKTAYMAPEYVAGRALDRRSDIFAMGVLFWEVLAGTRLFRGQSDAETITRVLTHTAAPVSKIAPFCGTRFDTVIGRALAKDPAFRHSTMLELADAVVAAARGTDLVASHRDVARLLEQIAGERLASRRDRVRAVLEREAREARERGEEEDDDQDDEFALTDPLAVQHESMTTPRASSVTQIDVGPPAPLRLGATVPLGAQSPMRPASGSSPSIPSPEPSRPFLPTPASAQSIVSIPTSEPFPLAAPRSGPYSVPAARRFPMLPVLLLAATVGLVSALVVVLKLSDGAAPAPSETTTSAVAAPERSAPIGAPAASFAAGAEPVPAQSVAAAASSAAPRAKRPGPGIRPTASPSSQAGATPTAASAAPPDTSDTPRPLPTNPYHR